MLRSKIFLLIIFLFINHQSLTTNHVYAVDATSSADSDLTGADLKDKLETLKLQIASKAAKLKSEINQKLQNKVYLGVIKTKSSSSLTLAVEAGTKIVSFNQFTQFESQIKRNKVAIKTLLEEDYIAALGDIDDTGVLTAKKIILYPSPKGANKVFIWGQIISVDKNLTLLNKEGKNMIVEVNSQTDLEKNGEKVSLSVLTKNNLVIIVGYLEEEKLIADFIYIYSQPAFLKPKKVATPSAEASKSATQKSP